MRLIEDVLKADEMAQNPSLGMNKKNQSMDSMSASPRSICTLGQLMDRATPVHSPRGTPMLSDFNAWGVDREELMETNGNCSPSLKIKHVKILTKAKISYIEKLEAYGLRSPTARH